jgi:hypothetical protein
MTTIRIERTRDSHECDCCGFSVADGARVFFDGVQKIDLYPIAHCYDGVDYSDDEDGVDYSDDEIALEILRELGSSVVYSTEYGYYPRVLKSLGHKLQVFDVPRG